MERDLFRKRISEIPVCPYSLLQDLLPDTEYSFRIGKNPKVYNFKTAPKDLKNGLKFVVGGDADQTRKLFLKMNETVVKKDPLFYVIGGDIAYAVTPKLNIDALTFNQWMSFFSIWKKQMVTKQRRVIPLIVLPGNHDILDKNAALYRTLFPRDKKSFTDLLILAII